MLDFAIEVLKIFEEKGYEAYIVGGAVRDYIMDIETLDIDITTNATPKEIRDIFPDAIISKEQYGSVSLIYKKIRFEITTYRIDREYLDNRKPSSISYINSIEEDLKRRDFTINTLLINSEIEVIDYFDSKKDITYKIIKTVKDPNVSFNEDAFRMLRAIRLATVLNFNLDDTLKKAIINNKNLILNLSYYRKKQELDKIFSSKNIEYGINLIKELDLESVLEIKINDIVFIDDVIGIWAQIDFSYKYQFTKNEKEMIIKIRELKTQDIMNNQILYQYGPYVTSLSAKIRNMDALIILEKYNNLPLKTSDDIDITSSEICELLNKKGGPFLKTIYKDISNKILDNVIENKKDKLKEYIKANY